MDHTFSSQSTSGSRELDRVSSKNSDSLSVRLDMASEEVVLSSPVEQVLLVHLNDSTHEVLNVDDLELIAR